MWGAHPTLRGPSHSPSSKVNSRGRQEPGGARPLDGLSTETAQATLGRPPAGLCPPSAETEASTSSLPERRQGASRGRQTDVRLARLAERVARGRPVPRAPGALGGPGPRAPCARCVRRPARVVRRAGAVRLRGTTSPPPPTPRGFGRQGAGAGGYGVHEGPACRRELKDRQVPRDLSVDFRRAARLPALGPSDAGRHWWPTGPRGVENVSTHNPLPLEPWWSPTQGAVPLTVSSGLAVGRWESLVGMEAGRARA